MNEDEQNERKHQKPLTHSMIAEEQMTPTTKMQCYATIVPKTMWGNISDRYYSVKTCMKDRSC